MVRPIATVAAWSLSVCLHGGLSYFSGAAYCYSCGVVSLSVCLHGGLSHFSGAAHCYSCSVVSLSACVYTAVSAMNDGTAASVTARQRDIADPSACYVSEHLPDTSGWLGSRVVSVLDSSTERPGFESQPRRCRVA